MDERYEVRSILEEFDEEGQGILSREEGVIVLQLIARRFRLIQHERERQYVISAGWTEGHFAEFRQAFWSFDEDMSEILERDELMKAVELLRGSYAVGPDIGGGLDLLLTALGMDPAKEVKVNFLNFLRMLKMLDETETRRQQGIIVGFTAERTDSLYTLFQAFEPESDGTMSRGTLELMFTSIRLEVNKVQAEDIMRMIKQEPLQVEWTSFLKLMKVVDGFMEAVDMDLGPCLLEMSRWYERHKLNLAKASKERDKLDLAKASEGEMQPNLQKSNPLQPQEGPSPDAAEVATAFGNLLRR
jgi:Ca2+-binding EF-hand superfamily protein